jgi:signal transduction histidine kinase
MPSLPAARRFAPLATPERRILVVAAIAVLVLAVLAATNIGGQAVLWENGHWTVAALAAATVAWLGARHADPWAKPVRRWAAIALLFVAVGQAVWDVEVAVGADTVPSVADIAWLGAVIPIFLAFRATIGTSLRRTDRLAVYLDAGAVFWAIVGLFILQGADAAGETPLARLLLIAYPSVFFGAAAACLVSALANRVRPQLGGAWAILVGLLVFGASQTAWAADASTHPVNSGAPENVLMSVALLILGFGAATWTDSTDVSPRFERIAGAIRVALPLAALAVAVGLTVVSEVLVEGTRDIAVHVAVAAVVICIGLRQALLLRDRVRSFEELQRTQRGLIKALDEAELATIRERRANDEMRRVQDQLIQASRLTAVGELAAAVAHEVNNPLTGVLGYADLMLAEAPPDDPARENLEVIRAEAVRARTVIWALLDFARPRPPERRPVVLADLAHATVELTRTLEAGSGGVTFVERYEPMAPVELDEGAIQQVLLNLLSNARQAVGERGTVTISTRVDGSDALIEVTDDGVGMTEDVRRRMFEPFFSTRPMGAGRGLGLAVAMGLVESHAGAITASSAVGHGTTIAVRLPLTASVVRAVDVPAAAPTPELVASATGNGS